MGYVDGDNVESVLGDRVRVRVRCSEKCMRRIGLRFELESSSVMRARARLSIKVMVRHG